jgi:hypothetical protein
VDTFTAHQLRFECEAVEPMELYEWQGSGLRGALYRSLWGNFCMNRDARECATCPLVQTCPVAFLVATLDPESERGVEVPRPYTIEPPFQGARRLEPGEPFAFGLTMFAKALNLFPYVVLALERMERAGLGRRVRENRNLRGRFRVLRVAAVNPLAAEMREVVRAGDSLVKVPDVPVTHTQIAARSARLLADGLAAPQARLSLEFLTPMRIRDRFLGSGPDRTLTRPAFRPIFQRLLERLSALSWHFGETVLALDFGDLVRRAEAVRLVADDTMWLELESQSQRQRHRYPSGGFVGRAVYQAEDWALFLPWLLWGQFTHVGKDAVKGNGWYRIVANAECGMRNAE